jgi:hypothetical protein
MIHYQQATRRDIRRVVPFLRKTDVAEIHAAGADIASLDWLGHGDTHCILVDRVPAGLMGVTPHGIIWMVGTDLLTRNSIEFLRACREEIPKLIFPFGCAMNWVWELNTLHRRWLTWLGAKWEDTTMTSSAGEPFRRFILV